MDEAQKKEFKTDKTRHHGRGAKRVDFARELENFEIQTLIQAKLMESRAYKPEQPTTPILNEILHEIKFRLDLLDRYEEKFGEAKDVFPSRFKKKDM
jgi:hypothetical protein